VSDHGSESNKQVTTCPALTPHRPRTNQDWWPNQPNLRVLSQHSPGSSPMGEGYNYAEEFKTLDVEALKR
jgi:catalase-peroxidase